jgi:hypothetical protein
VAKAIFGQQAGAAAVVMVNNATTLPPVEGPITSNPDDGTLFTVTIPFLGVRGTSATSDGGKLRAANGLTATVAPTLIPNTNYKGFADFSSGGPRTGDSFLKPDVTAPGVSIVSTGNGTGNGAATISGTSMASPHAAGVAALTKQAHPEKKVWKVRDLKAVIMNTADPSGVLGYRTSRGGTGLVQPALSTKSGLVAYAEKGSGVSLNYGYEELDKDFSKTLTMRVRNLTPHSGIYNVSATLPSGSPHSISIDEPSFSVGGYSDHYIDITLTVPAATVASSVGPGLSFQEVAGLIEVTPSTPELNNGIKARVPYYFVPRSLSDIDTKLASKLTPATPTTTANITNTKGVIAGDADFYAWGLSDGKDAGKVTNDVRAVGVQSFPFNATNQFIGFSVNTFERWSNPATNEFDINVDVNNDGKIDYIVVGADQGAIQTGSFNGRMGTFVFSTKSGGASINFFAQAPTDSSTANLFVLSSQLCRTGEPCLNAANPRFTYDAVSFDVVNGGVDVVGGKAKYNAWSPAISTAGFQTVAPGATASEPIAVNPTEWALTPALGLMVTSLDDKSKSGGEAQLIPVDFK